MKWIGITGSWRKTSPELEADLQAEVTQLLDEGNGVVTGGALGVDYLATKVTLEYAPDGSRIKVFLPTSLEIYSAHYRKRAEEGVITTEQAEGLIKQLETVNELGALCVNNFESVVDERTYYLRNTEVMEASDKLLGFHVNGSAGTKDTIDKAKAKGIPVKVLEYTIE
jgi:hypothetical protein